MKVNHFIRESAEFISVPLYVGSASAVEGTLSFRFRDKSRNSIVFVHNIVNEMTNDKFGLPLRSLFFCTPDPDHAATYGKLFEVTPIGDWRAFASQEVMDMTLDIGAMNYHIEMSIVKQFFGDDQDIVKGAIQPVMRKLTNEEDLNRFIEKLKRAIPQDISSDIDATLQRFKDELINKLNDYVDSIEELTEENAEDLLSDGAEVMLYSPNGINLTKV